MALTHPDSAGSHDLFIWVRALHEHVAEAKTLLCWDSVRLLKLVED
jgi:hypothetical protein